MTLEEAIRNALAYETRIRDLYLDAADEIADAIGRKVFAALAKDEQHHVDYLNDRLAHWQKTGALDVETLDTLVPPREVIQREVARLKKEIPEKSLGDEKLVLSRALAVEVETSAFYQNLVDTLDGDGQRMFARFLEIEEGHIAAVQAELDFLSHTGFWFDFQEFDLED
jgi:rubrerythrin